ncbi:MAG: hypothetical protein ACKO43_02435 [Alphaproteobacteria bacterium]
MSQNDQYDLAKAFLNPPVFQMNRMIERYGIPLEELKQIHNHAHSPDEHEISAEDIETIRQLPIQSLALLRDVELLVGTIPAIKQMYDAQRPFLYSQPALKIAASRGVFTALSPEKQEAVRAILLALDDNVSLGELPYGSPLAAALSPERDLLQEVTNVVLESCSDALGRLQRFFSNVMHNKSRQ